MASRKHVVFLMTDQHRIDHVGRYPGAKMQTPNIDRLGESVAFADCLTVNPICTPARTALLTGKYTHQIGMLAMSGDLSPQHPTYLRALQQAGYYTAAVGKFHWLQGWPWRAPEGQGHDLVALKDRMARFGLDYLWEVAGKQLAVRNYCEYCRHLDAKGLLGAFRKHVQDEGRNTTDAENVDFTGNPWPLPEEDYIDTVTGEQIVRAIRQRPKDRPLMLFGSFSCPHPPFDPPRSFWEQTAYEEVDDFIVGDRPLTEAARKRLYRLRRSYKATIGLVDFQVGRILQALQEEGIMDETVLLFTTDHGELMGDHRMMQKQEPWRSSATVPCLIRHPDHLAGGLNHSPVEITDLTATIMDVAGLDPRAALSRNWPAFHNRVPARSLLPILQGRAESVRDFAFSECNGRWQMIQTRQWKYIRHLEYDAPGARREQLYDRQADPQEQVNLAAAAAPQGVLEQCRRQCDFVVDRTPPAQLRWAPTIGPYPIEGE